MKNIITWLLFTFTYLTSISQVKWLNPKPSGYINEKVRFVNNSTGYMINSNGDFYVTNDTGAHWRQQDHFEYASTFAIHDSTGMIPSGNTTVYISSDNGVSWQPHATGIPGALESWAGIVGRDTLYVLNGYRTTMYRSVNRGITWQTINTNVPFLYPNSINFINAALGYASGPAALFKTTDSGYHWNPILVPNGANFTYTNFRDSLNGYTFNWPDSMFRTRDGGQTWIRGHMDFDIYDISWIDDDHAFAIGEYGYVAKTDNGGLQWTTTYNGILGNDDLHTGWFFDQHSGITAGARGRILKTTDDGSTWTQYSPTYIDVMAVEFGDVNTGYACTWNNVYKTIDRGESWQELPLTTGLGFAQNGRFTNAHFTSKDTGILIADEPVKIYKTVDGGQHWDSTYPAPIPNYYETISGCSFFSRDTGFIRTSGPLGGNLFKTTDAGLTWQNIPGQQIWSNIHFVDSRFGFGIWNNILGRTTNGGANWESVYIPFADGLTDIWFTSPAKGIAFYDNNNFVRITSDSGHTWTTPVFTEGTGNYYIGTDYKRVAFRDSAIGFITNGSGNMFRTTDGGQHWDTCGRIGIGTVHSISFNADSTVLLGGINGSILSLNVFRVTPSALCGGGSGTLQSNLTGASYQWQVNTGSGYTNITNNTNYNGVTAQSLLLTAVPSSWYGYKYSCKVGNYYSDELSLKVENHWTGAINNAWENPGNWSCGTVPDLNTDVIIGSGSVIVSSNITIRTLALAAGVNLTVTAPYTLTILH